MSSTNIFQNRDPMPSEQDPQTVNTMQTQADSRDAPLPGSRNNPALSVQNIHKSAPATGRRP